MEKIRIKLVGIGHLPLKIDFSAVMNWKSEIFEITEEIEKFEFRADSDLEYWGYSDRILKPQIPVRKSNANFVIAIVNVPLQDNWYSRRLGDNQIVFTFHQIKDFLAYENIPLENAILRVLYAYSLLYIRAGDKIPGFGEAASFTHDETRGCIFDMNGIKSDLVTSCDKPVICPECVERLKMDRVSTQVIHKAQSELKKIKKPVYYRIFNFVKEHPFLSFIFSSIFAVMLGIFGSLAASFIYEAIK
jgi:hypothetical protein